MSCSPWYDHHTQGLWCLSMHANKIVQILCSMTHYIEMHLFHLFDWPLVKKQNKTKAKTKPYMLVMQCVSILKQVITCIWHSNSIKQCLMLTWSASDMCNITEYSNNKIVTQTPSQWHKTCYHGIYLDWTNHSSLWIYSTFNTYMLHSMILLQYIQINKSTNKQPNIQFMLLIMDLM